MSLAMKLKELRLSKGESMQEVAKAVSVSRAHVWQLEAEGRTNPGSDLLKRLAKHFNVTVTYLLDETATAIDAKMLQFIREFEGKLTDKDWETLRVLAKRLNEKGEEEQGNLRA